MTPVLEARAVSRLFAGRPAVDRASLQLHPGEITALLGPSGSGKSTLLRILAGLEPADAGEVRAGDRRLSAPGLHVAPEQRDIGMVFQDYALFPHLSVLDNVAFGLRRLPRPERELRARGELNRVRLLDRAASFPNTLSGGEQQRVALARALARDPAVILLDEPFSGLDQGLRTEIRDMALDALRSAGAAALIVTHDAEDALLTADRLALMESGRILQTGVPEEVYARPVSLAAARLTGDADALPAQVRAGWACTAYGEIAAPGRPDGPALVMARPEAFRPAEDDGREVAVAERRFAGGALRLTLMSGGVPAHARWRFTQARAQTVRVRLDPRFCAVFDPV
ncbi:MAG: ABC transporter ATP-binding protein [Proteobacteria bacterium]|nr:ABC transporter ATP-binding protein [Pseudomonadota bacterium]